MTTCDKGDKAEVAVMNDLVRLGYKVLIPYGHNWRFDLVAYLDGRFIRIQVKKAIDGRGGLGRQLTIRAFSGIGEYKHKYTKDEVDVIAAFIEDDNEVIYIPISDFEGHDMMTIRRDEAGVGASPGGPYRPHYIKRYREARP